MTFPLSRRVICLTSVCCLLLAAIYWEMARPMDLPIPETAGTGEAARQTLADPAAKISVPPASAFAAISERPAFSEARRPPAIAPVAQPLSTQPASQPPPSLTLTGVILEPGRRLVVARAANSSKTLLLGEGDTIDGWQVSEILSDRIVLTNRDRRQEIVFPKPSAGAGGQSATPARNPLIGSEIRPN